MSNMGPATLSRVSLEELASRKKSEGLSYGKDEQGYSAISSQKFMQKKGNR